ncbi:hypothetical protein ACJX0J_013392, partial [Zea mays]
NEQDWTFVLLVVKPGNQIINVSLLKTMFGHIEPICLFRLINILFHQIPKERYIQGMYFVVVLLKNFHMLHAFLDLKQLDGLLMTTQGTEGNFVVNAVDGHGILAPRMHMYATIKGDATQILCHFHDVTYAIF